MANIAQSIAQKPSWEKKSQILNAFFRIGPGRKDLNQFNQYFRYYERELSMLDLGKLGYLTPGNEILVKTHDDLMEVVEILRSTGRGGQEADKRDLCEAVEARFKSDGLSASRTLDLALRLWLTLNVRDPEAQLQPPLARIYYWDEEETVQDFLSYRFRTSKRKIEAKDSRLNPSFTAAFMTRVCGLKLEWTDCLANHLRLDRRRNVLRIYPHKAVLQAHMDIHRVAYEEGSSASVSPFPGGLLMETVWSLNILFPQWDQSTNTLLKAHGQNFQQQGSYNGPPTLDLDHFEYWRDRLLEIYNVVYLAPPVSWAQLWRDRRNPQQFWTFWIALLISGLTLVSTVTGIIQAWASVKALSR